MPDADPPGVPASEGATPDTAQPDREPRPVAPPAGHSAAEAFGSLVELMRILRSPSGCPWDRAQTLDSLKPFVLEEAHEVVDAIERGDLDELRGEIGDLVFEGVFLAQLCADAGDFSIVDALHDVRAKLVRRHPHVFAPDDDTAHVTTPDAVKGKWEEIKATERADKGRTDESLFDRIPPTLPALLRAYEISTRAASVGFDWPTADAVLEKIDEELEELRGAMAAGERAPIEEEVGDLLFAVANLARKLGLEPEAALRGANRKFVGRFAAMQARFGTSPSSLRETTLDQMEAAWQEAKRVERG
jgi:ATP diphosphatase